MFGNSAVGQRATAALIVCALGVGVLFAPCSFAQTPNLFVDLDDVSGFVGQLVTIPVYVQTLADSLDGFEMQLSLSRDDLVYFEVDTVVVGNDTMWVCEVDTVGTLSSGWEHVEARSTAGKGFDLRLSGISDVGSGTVKGIPDYRQGVLVRFYARILSTVPDTLTDRVATIDLHDAFSMYSNQDGELILPVENLDGSVTIEHGIKGDVSCDGTVNPVDVVRLVNYVYKGWQSLCQVPLGDVNCNGVVNPIDVVILVNHVYKGWSMPC